MEHQRRKVKIYASHGRREEIDDLVEGFNVVAEVQRSRIEQIFRVITKGTGDQYISFSSGVKITGSISAFPMAVNQVIGKIVEVGMSPRHQEATRQTEPIE